MSLDLFLAKPPCPTCNHETEAEHYNYTYNVSRMWYAVYPDAKNMVDIDGMTGDEALPKILAAIKYMNANKDDLEAINPANGWGNYDGFLDFLIQVSAACLKNPDLVWSSWR